MPRSGRTYFVVDREAYAERRAIMEVEGVDPLTASRVASECGYHSRLGRVATAMANGDSQLAHEWRAEVSARFGEAAGNELILDIDKLIKAELNWKR